MEVVMIPFTQEFKRDTIYKVTHRTWDNKKQVVAKRKFLFRERRFGEIPCYCFTSRLTKRGCSSLVSIPQYDLLNAVEYGT